jgi:hypothetical protein
MVPENLLEVVSLLATCRKVKMREKREDSGSFFLLFLDSFFK